MAKRILKIAGIAAAVLAVLLVAAVVVIAIQPSELRVSREAVIAAPPEAVFAHVNDLQRWEAWSPWAKRDPAMKQTDEGPASGQGAALHWAGNDEVGEGTMTITESVPAERVVIELHFVKPFEDRGTSAFAFAPEGEQTRVTWTMTGENNFVAKAFSLFIDFDAMIGADFEQGLASLKGVVEAEAAPDGEPPGAEG